MTKRVPAKSKICRRLGVNLWGRPKNPIVKHDYPPGEHGTKRRKSSGYGQQLAAKQKLKGYYGNISERQFHRFYQEAARHRGAPQGAPRRRLPLVPAARMTTNDSLSFVVIPRGGSAYQACGDMARAL